MMKTKTVHSVLFGLAIGDALGVPVEFQDRCYFDTNPVSDMLEYGTHNQPAGTWSDDSSLTFCLAESLSKRYDLEDIATKFLQWYNAEIWTPYGRVFDIGIATRQAIFQISKGTNPILCGGFEENDNGNGSLMRILPLAFYLQRETNLNIIYQKVKEVSSITHAHFRSVFACFIYIAYALEILKGQNKNQAYENMQLKVNEFISENDFNTKEVQLFDRILNNRISDFSSDDIHSTGYVLHSLEASFWCILNSNSYEETVLKAVNLGSDTDTTAAIAGGLAGLLYGFDAIPEKWINQLARKNDILELCDSLELHLKNEK
ncbi:ADP-ribosylglycohydrolase family protein [Flavobacterium soli]|uniref:ADP-ribosylglycohydrolase family protein n=1 Tax=Flavobacterium soli TaxID=344881 RepID=UPI0004085B26